MRAVGPIDYLQGLGVRDHFCLARAASCPRTREYIARRRAEGKTDREIRRMLKRYIARELY